MNNADGAERDKEYADLIDAFMEGFVIPDRPLAELEAVSSQEPIDVDALRSAVLTNIATCLQIRLQRENVNSVTLPLATNNLQYPSQPIPEEVAQQCRLEAGITLHNLIAEDTDYASRRPLLRNALTKNAEVKARLEAIQELGAQEWLDYDIENDPHLTQYTELIYAFLRQGIRHIRDTEREKASSNDIKEKYIRLLEITKNHHFPPAKIIRLALDLAFLIKRDPTNLIETACRQAVEEKRIFTAQERSSLCLAASELQLGDNVAVQRFAYKACKDGVDKPEYYDPTSRSALCSAGMHLGVSSSTLKSLLTESCSLGNRRVLDYSVDSQAGLCAAVARMDLGEEQEVQQFLLNSCKRKYKERHEKDKTQQRRRHGKVCWALMMANEQGANFTVDRTLEDFLRQSWSLIHTKSNHMYLRQIGTAYLYFMQPDEDRRNLIARRMKRLLEGELKEMENPADHDFVEEHLINEPNLPAWHRNDIQTGFEIDLLSPSRKVAIMFDGPQHYVGGKLRYEDRITGRCLAQFGIQEIIRITDYSQRIPEIRRLIAWFNEHNSIIIPGLKVDEQSGKIPSYFDVKSIPHAKNQYLLFNPQSA